MSNTKDNENKKIPKSKAAIQEAFISLLGTKPADKITVKELSDIAGVNRKTFYTYYSCIEDLTSDVDCTLVSNIEEFLQNCIINEYGLGPQFLIQMINIAYESNPIFFENLFCKHNYYFFAQHIEDVLKEQLMLAFKKDDEQYNTAISYKIEFFLSGCAAIIIKWIKDGKVIPFDDVLSMLLEFTVSYLPS